MDTFTNSTMTGSAKAIIVTDLVHGARDLSSLYTAAAIFFMAMLTGSIKSGRTAMKNVMWFIDGLLGGAPHSVDLPGPPGMPIVGNLLEVSLLNNDHPFLFPQPSPLPYLDILLL